MMLATGAADSVFSGPVWVLWAERAVGVFILLLGVVALWGNRTWSGRSFQTSVRLDAYRSEGLAGVERLARGLSKRVRADDLYALGNELRIFDAEDDRVAAYTRAATLGDRRAMRELARLLFSRSDYIGAEHWFRQAQMQGVPGIDEDLAEATRRRAIVESVDGTD